MNQASHCRSLICYISSFNSYKQHEWGSRVVIVTLFKQVSLLLLRSWTNLCNIMSTNSSEQQWIAFKSDDNHMYFDTNFWVCWASIKCCQTIANKSAKQVKRWGSYHDGYFIKQATASVRICANDCAYLYELIGLIFHLEI